MVVISLSSEGIGSSGGEEREAGDMGRPAGRASGGSFEGRSDGDCSSRKSLAGGERVEDWLFVMLMP